ncbi:MAG: hypothetical protein OXU36_10680 [Candidatus Poribacteria bacterium]|nr:hypothetical protein [Candidatus Poribacteria bacterium]
MAIIFGMFTLILVVAFIFGVIILAIKPFGMRRMHGLVMILVSFIGMVFTQALRENIDLQYVAEMQERRRAEATADSVAAAIVAAKADSTAKAKAAEEAEKRRNGFHCLSIRDGSHNGLINLVKDYMNDPDSFTHIETRIAPVNEGMHTIIMEFTGKNTFGGRVRNTALGKISNNNCSAVLLRIE